MIKLRITKVRIVLLAILFFIDSVLNSISKAVSVIVGNKMDGLQLSNDNSAYVAYRLYHDNIDNIWLFILVINILIIYLIIWDRRKKVIKSEGETINDESK